MLSFMAFYLAIDLSLFLGKTHAEFQHIRQQMWRVEARKRLRTYPFSHFLLP
jgi:hypothetical protein